MRKRGTTLILLLVCFVHLVFTIDIAFASPDNWSEVTIFTGSETEQYITDYFTCDHVDWRIRWEYMPEDATFIVYTYQQKRIVDSITEGAKVEAVLSWHRTIESFVSAPDDYYLRISVEGNITNVAEFPVHNVILKLAFEIGTPIGSNPLMLAGIAELHWNETVNIGTLVSNETKQISEIFVYDVDFQTMILSDFSYEIEWDKSDGASGVSYVHNQKGIFYMEIISNAENFTIIIEQDLESIPEFPSWIILPLFLMATFSAVIVKKRLFHQRS